MHLRLDKGAFTRIVEDTGQKRKEIRSAPGR